MASDRDWRSTDPEVPPAIDAAIAPGATLADRYVVQCRIGHGGMGSVWRVHDQRTGEDVALKVLGTRPRAEALARFRREVTLARRIAHPNVCRMFDLGVADGLHVLTMELVEGTSLRTRLAQGPLPWPTARRVIDDLLAGLAAVHAAGVVHRDIKPENILIAADGRAVIADFGLAWAPTTQVATMPEVGTPQYMAPEQLSGKAVDPRSDVFAAGLSIHEILDGRSPFARATAAVVASAILRDPPQKLEGKQVPADARAAVARMLSRALGRDRATRQADAGRLRSEWLAATTVAPATHLGARIVAAIGIASVGAASAIFGFARPDRAPAEPATTRREAAPSHSTSDAALDPPDVAPASARTIEAARPDKPIAQQIDLVASPRPRPPRTHDDIALPSDDIVTTQDRSATPSDDIVTTQDRSATPSDDIATSPDGSARPSGDIMTSQDDSVNPFHDHRQSQDRSVNPFKH